MMCSHRGNEVVRGGNVRDHRLLTSAATSRNLRDVRLLTSAATSNERRLCSGSGRIGFRMNQNPAVLNADIERRHFFDERRRRCACIRLILVSVPGASYATKHNFALPQRAVLVLAPV